MKEKRYCYSDDYFINKEIEFFMNYGEFEKSPTLKGSNDQDEDNIYYFERPWIGFIITVIIIVVVAISV